MISRFSFPAAMFLAILPLPSFGSSAPHLGLSVSRESTAKSTFIRLKVLLRPHNHPLAAIKWDVTYALADLDPAIGFYESGPAAKASGKEVTCHVFAPGKLRCIVSGVNTNAIAFGQIATLAFNISEATRSRSSQLMLTDIVGVNAQAIEVRVSGCRRLKVRLKGENARISVGSGR